jgi:hypothetical protein
MALSVALAIFWRMRGEVQLPRTVALDRDRYGSGLRHRRLGYLHAMQPHPCATATTSLSALAACRQRLVISYQTRAWFNGPWRGGPRTWLAGYSGLGGWGGGDVESEGPELAEVGADLEVAVGFAFVPVGAMSGQGAQQVIHAKIPYKGKNKPEPQKAANRARARLRAPGERANAQLKTWRILRKLRCCPWRAGQLAKAIHALEIHAA